MFCILSECSASVRKSLQGLDYIEAEGTKAFDNLSDLVKQTCNYGDPETVLQENLKAGKLYLKSDFKVINVGNWLEHWLSKDAKRNHLFLQRKLGIFNIR